MLTGYTGSERMYDGWTRVGRDSVGYGYGYGYGYEDMFGRHIATSGTLAFETGPAQKLVLRWDTFRQATDEAGISRLYGGIHFQDGDLRGREPGRAVGKPALERARSPWDPQV